MKTACVVFLRLSTGQTKKLAFRYTFSASAPVCALGYTRFMLDQLLRRRPHSPPAPPATACVWSDGSELLDACVQSILQIDAAVKVIVLDGAGHYSSALVTHERGHRCSLLHGHWLDPLHAFCDASRGIHTRLMLCITRPVIVTHSSVRALIADPVLQDGVHLLGHGEAASGWPFDDWPCALLPAALLRATPSSAQSSSDWRAVLPPSARTFLHAFNKARPDDRRLFTLSPSPA